MNKKGLSNVVATVALILLVFAAIVIVINFVVPFVRDNLETGSECFPYRDYFSFEDELGGGVNCANPSASGYIISIRAKSIPEEQSEKIEGFKLSLITQSGSTTVLEVNDDAIISGMRMVGNCQSNCQLFIPKNGEVRIYVYSTTESFMAAEIFPKLNNGRVCDKSDSISSEINNLCS